MSTGWLFQCKAPKSEKLAFDSFDASDIKQWSLYGQRAFWISAPNTCLPANIQLAGSLTVFKKRLENFVFQSSNQSIRIFQSGLSNRATSKPLWGLDKVIKLRNKVNVIYRLLSIS